MRLLPKPVKKEIELRRNQMMKELTRYNRNNKTVTLIRKEDCISCSHTFIYHLNINLMHLSIGWEKICNQIKKNGENRSCRKKIRFSIFC